MRAVTVLWAGIILLSGHLLPNSKCNTISTTTEATQPGVEDGQLPPSCSNAFPDDFCEVLMESESCPESTKAESSDEDTPLTRGCKKSCGLCNETDSERHSQNEEGQGVLLINELHYYEVHEFIDDDHMLLNADDGLEGGKCEDKLPDCSKYLSVCCSMKDAMNVSCPKTCRFCTETPSSPGGPVPPGAPVPTGSTNQDPCGGSSNPPSVTVDAPGQTTTTTTLSPVTAPSSGTLPPVGG